MIEIEEDPETVFIPEMNERVTLMTQGLWMKGCPEPGEQQHLFSLYSLLSEGSCPCPHGCGTSFKRHKSDFFGIFVRVCNLFTVCTYYVLQATFSKYIEQVTRIVRQRCTACHKKYCIACGEAITLDKAQRPNAAAGDEPLFHCSNLQGAILGIGLSMLESVYADVLHDSPDSQDIKARATKKRKVDATSHASTPDGEDDDTYYGTSIIHGKGKKAKGGTGYAGDLREDV